MATLEEIRNMKPENFQIDHPWIRPEWMSNLLWRMDNYPERTVDQYRHRKRELKKEILRVVQRASILRWSLEKEGNLEPDQIQEYVNDLVAPKDGPAYLENPKPLDDDLREEIIDWSNDLRMM